jgi:putative ABC transport system ATP-binding protein
VRREQVFDFIDVKYKNIIDIPVLNIEKEKITTLIGSSGSGKTTILRMLNKMISPTEGKILYNGADLRCVDSVSVRREISLLSQNPIIFEGSIRDNLNVGMVFQGKGIQSDYVLRQVLEQVKLKKDLDGHAVALSGGEKQRLALGRIMILNPCVYLLDEPSSALDDETEDVLIQTITEYAKSNNKTIIMVTHSKTIAQKFSDIIIEISEGKSKRRLDYERNH